MGHGRHQQMVGTDTPVIQEVGKAARPRPTINALIDGTVVRIAGDALDRSRHFVLEPQRGLWASLGVPAQGGLILPPGQAMKQDDVKGHPCGSLLLRHLGPRDGRRGVTSELLEGEALARACAARAPGTEAARLAGYADRLPAAEAGPR